ncbi:MAG: hypothetical protein OXF02_05675 [Simkaniaceae bacterium]|nr:hypothetical protein [Simkaniaceae bacterium]
MSTRVAEEGPLSLSERVEPDDMEICRKVDDEMRGMLANRMPPSVERREWLFAIWTVGTFTMAVALCIGSVLRLGFGVHCFDWLMHPAVLVPLTISSPILNRYCVGD